MFIFMMAKDSRILGSEIQLEKLNAVAEKSRLGKVIVQIKRIQQKRKASK